MKVINIEGIDAVGKETVSKALEKRLDEMGFRVKRVSFPIYKSSTGRVIKDVLHGACGDAPDLDYRLMGPLYTIDRMAYFNANPVEKLSEMYDYLICDRSFYSNFMYQASKIYHDTTMYYNNYDIPHELLMWMMKNYEWEFEKTGLSKSEENITFVLTLSEEDNLKQMKNRKVTDTNEKNRVYLNECRKFIMHMTNDHMKKYVEDVFDYSEYNKNETYLDKYILNVHPIEVVHANTPDYITSATYQTVNKIMEYLFPDDENNKKSTFNLTDEENAHISLFCNIGYAMKRLYLIMKSTYSDRLFTINLLISKPKNEEARVEFSYTISSDRYIDMWGNNLLYLSNAVDEYKKDIIRFIDDNYEGRVLITYDGTKFTCNNATEDFEYENRL